MAMGVCPRTLIGQIGDTYWYIAQRCADCTQVTYTSTAAVTTGACPGCGPPPHCTPVVSALARSSSASAHAHRCCFCPGGHAMDSRLYEKGLEHPVPGDAEFNPAGFPGVVTVDYQTASYEDGGGKERLALLLVIRTHAVDPLHPAVIQAGLERTPPEEGGTGAVLKGKLAFGDCCYDLIKLTDPPRHWPEWFHVLTCHRTDQGAEAAPKSRKRGR